MKKASPNSESSLDRIRSWARTKAHGPSPLSTTTSRSPTLPISNQDLHSSQTQTQTPSATQRNDTTDIPPFPSTDIHGLARQSSKPTENLVAVESSSHHPPPAPPPQDEGSGPVVGEEKPPKKNVVKRFWYTGKSILFSSYINLLLVFVPAGIAVKAADASPGLIFGLNAIAIVPLAGLLTHATESVAKRMGDTIGALMNVTFGNAVELIIFIIALTKNEIRIVQASLLGSILANLLLILGMCFLIGGLRFREQIYNSTVTQMSACLLSLSVMSLLLPTAFHASFSSEEKDLANNRVLKVSRGTSVILLIVYGMYLLFQLKSHAYMYESTPQHLIDEESAPGPVAAWMESSDDSSSSSSSSDSDGSSGSNTTAKKIKRVIRGGRRRRKSSAGSKETVENEKVRTPSIGTGSVSLIPAGTGNDPHVYGHRLDGVDFVEDGDDEQPHRRSRKNSIIEKLSKKERRKERKRQEKRERQAHRKGDDTIIEGEVQDNAAPRRVDFAPHSVIEPHVQEVDGSDSVDSPLKRPFNLLGIRPQMPKSFSQNVFMQPSPVTSLAQPSGPIPRVRYGIRRTNSLPDRLNQTTSAPATRHPSTAQAPSRPGSLAVPGTPNVSDEAEAENISRTTAVMLLVISIGLVALCAEFMVDSISDVVKGQSGVSEAFIGLIVLPIVGNASEHYVAVTVAQKNKMDLAIGVAVGSSIQIALFVTPFIVLLGWAMSKEMTLYFTLFETVSLFVSAFIVNFLVLDGRSNYLEGALLIAAYVIIAVAAFFYPNVDEQSNLGGNAEAASKMIRSLVGF